MDCVYKKIPKIIKKTEYYQDGANTPTRVDVHKCFCLLGKGTVERHYVPGFNDEWFEIKCKKCEKKYEPYIDRCGDKWTLYFAQPDDELDGEDDVDIQALIDEAEKNS